jgi:excisionase family DNA binding protein
MPESPASSPLGPILDSRDIAAILKLSPRSVQRLIHTRELKAYKIGRRYRVLAKDFEEFFTKHPTR